MVNSQAIASNSLRSQKSIKINGDLQKLLLSHGYQEIPIRLSKNNFLMIDVSLGDTQTLLPFMLDTAATGASIDQKIQEKYKFKREGKSFVTGGAGGHRFQTHVIKIPIMRLGNVSVTNQLAAVQHYSHIKVDKKSIAGQFGLDFLRQHQAVLDVGHRRLFLKLQPDKSLGESTLQNTLTKMGYKSIQLKRSPSEHQTILVKINDAKPVQFILDTGAAPIMIASYYAKNITLKNKGNLTTGQGSSKGIMKMFTAQVDKITINSFTWGPQGIFVTTGLEDAKVGIPIFGLVGLNWMVSHRAIMDAKNDLLFVKYS